MKPDAQTSNTIKKYAIPFKIKESMATLGIKTMKLFLPSRTQPIILRSEFSGSKFFKNFKKRLTNTKCKAASIDGQIASVYWNFESSVCVTIKITFFESEKLC